MSKSSQSSPYIRSTAHKQMNRSRSGGHNSDAKSYQLSTGLKGFSAVAMPTYIGHHKLDESNSRSRSRSKGAPKPHVSNNDKVQVVRDQKGIKRKIEYFDATSDEQSTVKKSRKDSMSPVKRDDLVYSKS